MATIDKNSGLADAFRTDADEIQIEFDDVPATDGNMDVAAEHGGSTDNNEIEPVDAGGNTTETTGRLPTEGAQEIIADINNIVRLPAGTSLGDAEIEGLHLVLNQADGSKIILKNAAINLPTIYVGEVEFTQEVLAAAFQLSGINIAAGPDGATILTSGGNDSSGNNFPIPTPGIGEAGPVIDLLGKTELLSERLTQPELYYDVALRSELSIDKQVIGVFNQNESTDPDGEVDAAGDVVEYQITVSNTGDQVLTNVVVTDPLTGLSETIPSLAPGESYTYTVYYTVTQADIDSNGGGDGDIDNTALADSDQTDPVEDTETVEVVQNPVLTIDKIVVSIHDPSEEPVDDVVQVTQEGLGVVDEVGDVIEYDIVVTNNGNQTLTDVVVTDPLTGTSETIASLAPGESYTYTVFYEVTQADIDSNATLEPDNTQAGFIDNTATADSNETDEISDSESVPVAQSAALSIDKIILNVTNPDQSASEEGVVDEAGDVIEYAIEVTNTGGVTLTNIVVTDPLTGGEIGTIASLEPGETQTFQTSYTVTQDDIDSNATNEPDNSQAGYIDNTATADSDQTDPVDDSETVQVLQNASITIDKVVIDVGGDGPDGSADAAGDVISYEITVTNNGNQTLDNVVVTDPLTGTNIIVGTLGPNDSVTIPTSYEVTQADIDNNGGGDGDIDNTATVDSDQTDPVDDSETVQVLQNASITIDKVVIDVGGDGPDGSADAAGDVISYEITVTNNGNQTLDNVVVTDPLTGTNIIVGTLGPNDSVTIPTSYEVTQADIDNNGGGDGDIDNTATVDSDQTDPVDDSETVQVLQNASITIDKVVIDVGGDGPDGSADAAGDVISYEITVTNNGNQTLDNVVVTDPLTGTNIIVGTLGPNDSVTIPTSYEVTQADIDNNGGGDGDIDNTATVDSDQTDPVDDSETVQVLQNASITIDKVVIDVGGDGPDGSADAAGDVISYEITVTNNGNQTLDNVVVTDPLTGTNIIVGTLGPNDSVTIPTSYEVTQADIDNNGGGDGDIDNTATVDSDQTDPVDDSETVQVLQNASITIDKVVIDVGGDGPDGSADAAGDVISYEITVTNNGNQTLDNVVVTDPLTGTNIIVGTLGPNDSVTIPTSYEVTQADIDNNGGGDGDIDNTATVDSDQTDPVDDSETVQVLQNASITIDKVVIDVGGDGPDGSADAAGDVISYEITVTNNGNQTLDNVVVTDPLTGTNIIVGTLGPNDSVTIPTSYEVTQADIDNNGGGDGDIDNTATVDSDQTDPVDDSETVQVLQNASITIDKVVIDVGGDGPDGSADAAGDVISYEITVTNNGNQTLDNVVVTDPLTGTNIIVGTLGPNDSVTIPTSYEVTQADIDNNGGGDGDIDNTATVDSDQTDPVDDSETVQVLQNASITIDKVVIDVGGDGPDGSADAAGDVISYEITVTNNGNQTLDNVVVTDPLTGTNIIVGTLGPNDSVTIPTSYEVTQADIDNNGGGDGDIDNTATVDSDQTDPVDDSETVQVLQNASITIDKVVIDVGGDGPDGSADAAGDVISYEITVTNNGNQTLDNVVVTDPLTGTNIIVGTLGPNDSVTIPTSYEVTQADIDNNGGGDGDIDNTATVDSDQTDPVDDSETVQVLQNASITIDKVVIDVGGDGPDGSADAAGDVISYEITVTNNGNQTLDNVVVTDPLTGTNIIVGTLGPNDSVTIPTSYEVTQADIDNNGGGDGDIDNTATVDSDQTDPVDDSETVQVLQNASITIDKVVIDVGGDGPDGSADAAGDVISYEITVTNNGNQTLDNVVVTDPLTGTNIIVGTLGPNDSVTIPTSYEVTQADIDNNGGGDGDIDNTATVDSDQTDPVDDSETVQVLQNASITIDKVVIDVGGDGPDGSADAAGDVISYEITVTNNGNQTLDNVVVTDPLTGTNIIVGTLGPNDSVTIPTSYEVTQADIDNNGGGDGDIDNTATVDSDQTDPVDDSETVQVLQNASITIDKVVIDVGGDGPDGSADAAGDVISYEITVTNNGNQTLDNVVVTDPLTGTNIIVGTLGPNDSVTIPTSYEVTQADIDNNGGGDGDIDNTATVDSDQTDPVDDSETVQVLQNASITIDKVVIDVGGDGPDGSADAAGDVISYEITVTNNGNQTLDNVVVTDPLTGTNIIVGTLGPNDSVTIPTSYEVTQADIDNNGGGDGDIDNTATVDSDQTDPVDDSETVQVLQNASITIDKVVIDVGGDGPDGSADAAGDVISYEITVTNNGNQTLDNVVVTDPLTGTNIIVGTLGPNDSVTIPTSYEVTQADIDNNGGGDGDIDNTATVDSDQTDPVDDSETVQVLQNASITIDKVVIDVGGDGPDGSADAAGDVISYEITVTNNGNQTLDNVVVTDPLTGTNIIVGTLGPNDSVTIPTSYEVTQADIDNNGGGDGDIDNTATVDSDQTDEVTDSEAVPVLQNAVLAIDKEIQDVGGDGPGGSADAAGDIITYDITVTNNGNQTLTNVTVVDPLTGTNVTIPVDLAPGQSYTVEDQTYTVTQADIDNNGGGDGDIDNTATVDSDQTDEVTDSEAVPVLQNAVLAIDKEIQDVGGDGPGGSADAAGDIITYDITVTNNGNQTLTNVTVVDPLTGTNVTIPVDLAPGQSYTVEDQTYTVTQADIDNNGGGDGDIDNTATANSDQTDEVTDSEAVPLNIITPVVTAAIDDLCIFEDTQTVMPFSASVVDGTLTEIVITGLDTDATYDLSGLLVSGVTLAMITDDSGTTGTITIDVSSLNLTSYSANLQVTPDAQSDVDMTAVSVTASGISISGITDDDTDTAYVTVDAVADAPTNVSITVTDDPGDGDSSFSLGETGNLNVTADFSDTDGSESHELDIQLHPGFTAEGLTDAGVGTETSPNSGIFTGTYLGYDYTYDASTGEILIDVGNDPSVNLDIPVTAPSSGTLSGNLTFAVDVNVDETNTNLDTSQGDAECTLDNNSETVSASTGIPATQILDGAVVTNTNQNNQSTVLTFQSVVSPLDAYAAILLLNAQGQQGSLVADAGFNINSSHDFNVVLEDSGYSSGKIQFTDFSLEGVEITPPSGGNIALSHTLSGNTDHAIVAVINPDADGGTNIDGVYSTNGGNGPDTIGDPTANEPNYLYGYNSGDTLNGSDEADILNGGDGVDTLNGNGGNDILVFDAGDSHNGGDGFDILRIDDAANFNTERPPLLGPTSGFSDNDVDLVGEDITGIEAILITEEASPDATLGTDLEIDAQDILDFTDGDNELYIIGSEGDTVLLSDENGTLDADFTDTGNDVISDGGQVFSTYTATINNVIVTLHVDDDITVI